MRNHKLAVTLLMVLLLWPWPSAPARATSPATTCTSDSCQIYLPLSTYYRQITLLANMITLTPGTLTVDVTEDRSALIVHAIDCPDVEAACADIRNGFERLIREAFS